MKEQRETNNASPAVPVNLQMWPSAPREEEKGEAGGGAEIKKKCKLLLRGVLRSYLLKK